MHEQSEVSMFFITPVKMSGYTTALSLFIKHIWNRYYRQPSLAQAIVSMKKKANI